MSSQVVEYKWRPHPTQYNIFASKARFQFAACGRRWGKTEVAWAKLLTAGMEKPDQLYWWVAPINRELIPASQTIRKHTPPQLFVKKYERQNIITYIQLPNGTEIYFHSANTEDSLRGSGLHGVVIDEGGSFPESRYTEEILPSLIDYGGWMLAIGTPKGRNWFYTGYLKGQDKAAYPDYDSWTYSSYENTIEKGGYLRREDIDMIAGVLPELTRRQEIGAEFLSDEGQVFRPFYGGEFQTKAPLYSRHVIGLDIARAEDFTVITALNTETGQLEGMDRWNTIDWELQAKRIKSFMSRFPGIIWLDATSMGGDQFYERLKKMGLRVKPFLYTNRSKRELVENLMLCFDEERLMVPKSHPVHGAVMKDELEAFTYEVTKTGNIRYNAPSGLHDDCVNSLALAAYGAFSKAEGFILWV